MENFENKSGSRRDFLKKTGKQALWMAPTLTVLMTASSQPAKATYNTYKTPSRYDYQKKQKIVSIVKKFFGWLKSKHH